MPLEEAVTGGHRRFLHGKLLATDLAFITNPRGSQLMISVYEDLNLGIYFGILGLFWRFF